MILDWRDHKLRNEASLETWMSPGRPKLPDPVASPWSALDLCRVHVRVSTHSREAATIAAA